MRLPHGDWLYRVILVDMYKCPYPSVYIDVVGEVPAALVHPTIFSVSEAVQSCVVHGWRLRCCQLLQRVHRWCNPNISLRFAGVARAARYCRVSWAFPVVPGRLLSVSDTYITPWPTPISIVYCVCN